MNTIKKAILLYLGAYAPFLNNYFTFEGESFLNLNSLSISGILYNGDSDNFILPEKIYTDESLIVNSGADLKLQAQQGIYLSEGFVANVGSNFEAKVEPIEDCNTVYDGNYNTTTIENKLSSNLTQFQEELNNFVKNKLIKEPNRQISDLRCTMGDNGDNNEKKYNIPAKPIEGSNEIELYYDLNSDEYVEEIKLYSLTGSKVSSLRNKNLPTAGKVLLKLSEFTTTGIYVAIIVTHKTIHTSQLQLIK